MKAVFLRALEANDKASVLTEAIRSPESVQGEGRFELEPESFSAVPSSPFAYWVSSDIREVFLRFPEFESQQFQRTTRCGLGTLDDFRFLRLIWESGADSSAWKTYYHGGVFSPFYDEFPLAARWVDNGNEVKCFVEQKVGSASRKVQAEDRYFDRGFVFPRRTKALAPKVMPSGGIFSTGGQAGFVSDDELLASIALLSASVCSFLISITQGRTGDAAQFEVGLIKRLPWPYQKAQGDGLSNLARRAWSLKRALATSVETSRAFALPAVLQVAGDELRVRVEARAEHIRGVQAELDRIDSEIDRRSFDLYGIGENDRRVITEQYRHPGHSNEADVDESALAAQLVSWVVGVVFGRFDVRLATGTQPNPVEPDPFAPLPHGSPGMLAGRDEKLLLTTPSDYPVVIPELGVLVDDPGHSEDLGARVRVVFDNVFGSSSDVWWHDIAEAVDATRSDLQSWLRSKFFGYHTRLYSDGRRKAPIYWQLSTSSAQYSVWLYAHRLTRDSFFQIQNDVVAPKLVHEERKLASLVQGVGGSPSAKERKEIAAQESFVEELRAMLEEVKRVAPLWNPNLDDGVVLTMAPLWRLVPQHKSWQKELRSRWDELCDGKYDWAHVAMHLWPERVVPQCAKDRSLAIAHGLEDVFWAEGDNGKWTARSEPTQPIDELVKERTSSAVKAALASLLEAPVPGTTGRGRRKGSRATSAKGKR